MKTDTDLHWNRRAASVANDVEVNIMDIFQRDVEYDHVSRFLRPDMTVLETGCGNGFSSAKFRPLVRHLDGFDYAENMIERAKTIYGETNNRFLHDNLLEPANLGKDYDCAICVRVLINLADLEQQIAGVNNLAKVIKPSGILILVEGFMDGFVALNELRAKVGLPPIVPASINFYSYLAELMPTIEKHFTLEDQFHLGSYDYLTRVFYPLVVGPENALHNTEFVEKCSQMARAFSPDAFSHLSRIKGLVLKRR
jgi:SAM-dependent methyltransferase